MLDGESQPTPQAAKLNNKTPQRLPTARNCGIMLLSLQATTGSFRFRFDSAPRMTAGGSMQPTTCH